MNITLLSSFWYIYIFFMILVIHSWLIKSKDKLLVESMFSRITFILWWFWYFSVPFLLVIIVIILVRASITRLRTIFPMYLLKISTNLLSSETTLLFSTKVANYFNFQSIIRKQRFYCNFFRLCILHWDCCKIPVWSFLVVSHKKFLYHLCIELFASVFPFYSYLATWNKS